MNPYAMAVLWGSLSGLAVSFLYMFLIEPLLRFLAQWEWFEEVLCRWSFLIAVPIPSSYGKWRIFAMFGGIFPVKIRSPQWPWEMAKGSYKAGLKAIRHDRSLFKVEWY